MFPQITLYEQLHELLEARWRIGLQEACKRYSGTTRRGSEERCRLAIWSSQWQPLGNPEGRRGGSWCLHKTRQKIEANKNCSLRVTLHFWSSCLYLPTGIPGVHHHTQDVRYFMHLDKHSTNWATSSTWSQGLGSWYWQVSSWALEMLKIVTNVCYMWIVLSNGCILKIINPIITIQRDNKIPVLYSFKNRICTRLELWPRDRGLEQMAEVLSKAGYANVRRLNEVWSVGLWPFGVRKGVWFSIYSIQPNIPEFLTFELKTSINGHIPTSRYWPCWAPRMTAVASVGFIEVTLALPWCLWPLGKSSFPVLSSSEAQLTVSGKVTTVLGLLLQLGCLYFRLLFWVLVS